MTTDFPNPDSPERDWPNRGIGPDREKGEPFRTQDRIPVRRGPGCLGGCLLLVLGLIAGVLLLGWVTRKAFSSGEGMAHRMANYLLGSTTTIDTSSAAVVQGIQRLSRLETVVYSLDKIVVGERQSNLLPNALAGDKLLLIAHGEVIAGVDLNGLKPSDVTVQGDHVSVRMPPPMVLSTRLDNAKTRVFSRDTGLLVLADPNLETETRKAAESQIEQAAIADGILDKARVNAKASVETLLYGLGFHSVDVR